eukprot:scaffold9423_cov88-Skeletonema_marinoi.AAC.2
MGNRSKLAIALSYHLRYTSNVTFRPVKLVIGLRQAMLFTSECIAVQCLAEGEAYCTCQLFGDEWGEEDSSSCSSDSDSDYSD